MIVTFANLAKFVGLGLWVNLLGNLIFIIAAEPIAHRILERVAGVSVEGYGKPIRLTCSIGIAASDTLGVWGEHLIAQADAAVYVAQRKGRNQVQMAAPLAA